jgi:hypothetical protein
MKIYTTFDHDQNHDARSGESEREKRDREREG